MRRVLFIDRDGTILIEPPDTYQVDRIEKFAFLPGAIAGLRALAADDCFELVMVSNQDGLGTPSLPHEHFWPLQELMVRILESEGIRFASIHIDDSFKEQRSPNRKPGTGMLSKYLSGHYDLANSFVIGDRATDVELAANLGAKAIYLGPGEKVGAALSTSSWEDIVHFLRGHARVGEVARTTQETSCKVKVNLDGSGSVTCATGIGFLDHMLNLFAFHAGIDLEVSINGDLKVDEHHSVEDCALTLGEAIRKALGKKEGIARYGFSLLPMDESIAQVAIDFSGRPFCVFNACFARDRVGDFPTELTEHFFASLAATGGITMHLSVTGRNDHHQIEALFKGLGRAMRMATAKSGSVLPSTKGVL